MTPSAALRHLERFPYDITPAITALSNAADLDDPALAQLCARIAAAMPSHTALEDLLGDRGALMANFYPAPPEPEPDTNDTIDTFLSTFGTPDRSETEALEKLIFNPVPDYAAALAAEERAAPLPQEGEGESEHDRIINSFIRAGKAREQEQMSVETPPSAQRSDKSTNQQSAPAAMQKSAEPASLTESFVRVLIKNRNYSKALQIISEINLKNPEKSIYFADQMRFLKKLIINETKK